MRAVVLVALVAAVVLFAPAVAQTCQVTTSPADVRIDDLRVAGATLGSGEANSWTFYVVNELCQPSCVFSTWIYQESNGIDGLQRQDEDHDDTCGGEYVGDVIVW